MEIREYQKEELSQVLEFVNSLFTPRTPEMWKAQKNTAFLAKKKEELVGVTPFSLRQFKLSPALSILVAFENAVGVKEEWRNRGIGSKIIEVAAEELKNRVDALFVYRAGERTPGYRFYRKTGHSDLLYAQKAAFLNQLGSDEKEVEEIGIHQAIEREKEFLELFNSTYKNFGGFPIRKKGYWQRALNSYIYLGKIVLLYLRREGRIFAYAVVQKGKEANSILEIAGQEPLLVKKVLQKIFWQSKDKKVEVYSTPSSMYLKIFQELGGEFEDGHFIMARVIQPQHIFQKALQQRTFRFLQKVEISISTPARDVILHQPGFPIRKIKLAMKENSLTRWLLCRADFEAEVKEERIKITGHNKEIIEGLNQLFPFTNWHYFAIDFI